MFHLKLSMLRLRLVLAALAVSLLAVGAVTVQGATPAQAAAGGNCAANSFCLYQWTNYGALDAGDRWQTTFSNFYNHGNQCINISPATWDNGTPVADNSGSMQWNGSSTWSDYTITFYNWVNCNAAGAWGQTPYLSGAAGYPDLSAFTYPSPAGTTIKPFHTITSVDIQFKDNG